MAPLEFNSLMQLIVLVSIVSLATLAGLVLNRILTYRAHRKAISTIKHNELTPQSIPLTISSERIVRSDA